jgi:hypothetical protein
MSFARVGARTLARKIAREYAERCESERLEWLAKQEAAKQRAALKHHHGVADIESIPVIDRGTDAWLPEGE